MEKNNRKDDSFENSEGSQQEREINQSGEQGAIMTDESELVGEKRKEAFLEIVNN